MGYRLFLDDEREPPRGDAEWVIVRTCEEAAATVSERGLPAFISFDHDLGMEGDQIALTGYDFARWLVDFILDHDCDMATLEWFVHSQNPVGVERINGLLGGLARSRACDQRSPQE